MRRIQARHWGWLAPVAAVVAIMVACSGREAEREVPPVTVRTAPVLAGEDLAPLRFAGVVRARQRAELTFQVSGTLHERPADIGQPVVAGDLMARLRNPQLIPARDSARARIRETDAQLRQAEQEYQRAVTLRERGVGRLTIKKRGVDVVPEDLRKRLSLSGDAEATLVMTRVAGSGTALLVQPL